jgi:hypothetical protein
LSGGGNHAHNITGFGNFYPIMFFGLVVGLGSIFIKPKTWQLLLVGWLLAGSVAPLMTLQANHTIRFSPAFVAIEILSVYGFIVLFQKMQKYISKKALFSLIIILIMGLSYSAFRFLVHYNYFFPQQDARHWSWQMKTLVYWLDEQKANYDAIYLEDEQYSPYVYFLFYRQDDPASLKGRMDYYPHDAEGFRHVERLDNFYFRQIDWNDTQLYFDKRVLFIVEEEQIPAFNRFHEDYLLLTTLKHEAVPMGIEIWEYQGKN